jgi:hypothetical protein
VSETRKSEAADIKHAGMYQTLSTADAAMEEIFIETSLYIVLFSDVNSKLTLRPALRDRSPE